jgi:CBS domain-containing protein
MTSSSTTGHTTRVSEVMTVKVLTVKPDQPADAAVDIIVDHVITGVPVVDEDNRCIGIVSESDVLSKTGKTVSDVMTASVISVEENATLEEATEILLTRRIRRLPVTRDGKLVGILTRADVVRRVRHTHWVCEWCQNEERGLRPPNACTSCGGESFHLVAEERK